MQCTDRGTETCGMVASCTCHRCDKQICQSHALDLPSYTNAGHSGRQSTCRTCTEAIVADMAHELDNVHMKLALAFQQADYWSEHLTPQTMPSA